MKGSAGFDRRGVLALVCCLLVVALTGLALPGDLDLRRRHIDIAVGETAATSRYAALTVTEVEVGTRAQADSSRDPITTDHRFVAVSAAVAVAEKSAQLTNIFLVTTDGHRYVPRREMISAGPTLTEPGFTRTFTVLFEVPPERVPGARVLFDGEPSGVEVYREAVRVDPGLTDPKAGVGHDLVLSEPTMEVTR